MDFSREVRRYTRLILNWWWLIVLGVILAGGINYYLTSKAPPKYEASTTLMVGQVIRQANPDQSEIPLADRLAVYYLELLRRQPILEGVKNELNLNIPNEQLSGMVSARVIPATAFIEIVVTDVDPTRAVQLVNNFGKQLIAQSPTAPENQRKEQADFIQKQMDDLQNKIEEGRKKIEELNLALSSASTAAEVTEIRGQIKTLETQIDTWQTNYTNLIRQSTTNSPNSINILEESKQPRLVKGLNPLIAAAITGAIGGFLAIICAIVLEYLDDRLKNGDDISTRLKLRVLGHVPRIVSKKTKNIDNEIVAEAYEVIGTNILFSEHLANSRRALLLTAPDSASIQPEIALNLGIAMANFNSEVLLVDANVKTPSLHKMLEVDNNTGFFEIFYGNSFPDIEDLVHETGVPNLFLMTAGDASPEKKKLMVLRPGSEHIYGLPHNSVPGDIVVFNCDSILTEKTPRLLANHVSGIILVCELKKTRSQELKATIEVIERLKGYVLGVITIDAPRRSSFHFIKLLKQRRPEQSSAKIETSEAVA